MINEEKLDIIENQDILNKYHIPKITNKHFYIVRIKNNYANLDFYAVAQVTKIIRYTEESGLVWYNIFMKHNKQQYIQTLHPRNYSSDIHDRSIDILYEQTVKNVFSYHNSRCRISDPDDECSYYLPDNYHPGCH